MKYKKPYQLALEQRTVILRAQGVSTLLSAQDLALDYQKLVVPMLDEKWGLLLDIRQWQPSPQPVFEVLRQIVSWSYEHNLRQVDLIQPNDPLLLWQYLKSTDVTRPDDVIRNIHDDETVARLSLQAAGYLA
ncbi:hypothetical protein EOE67_10500 [Rheinheimera riviphila]|uniref:STAS/SEC14 domain-containing protein n=1 Tax=Rheinheimera riviphila TaxID=1834037 RepID=A0A437QS52_9GAMM|nr:hypothetical protein [Rheinheimera riviphila]RVU37312.1 hypothetical protein EOE67_10500 [Rheinheimera riviphila]